MVIADDIKVDDFALLIQDLEPLGVDGGEAGDDTDLADGANVEFIVDRHMAALQKALVRLGIVEAVDGAMMCSITAEQHWSGPTVWVWYHAIWSKTFYLHATAGLALMILRWWRRLTDKKCFFQIQKYGRANNTISRI